MATIDKLSSKEIGELEPKALKQLLREQRRENRQKARVERRQDRAQRREHRRQDRRENPGFFTSTAKAVVGDVIDAYMGMYRKNDK